MTHPVIAALLAGVIALSLHGAALAQTSPAPPPSGKDVMDKTAEAWETLKGYTHARKNDAVAYGKKLMSQTDAEIKQLQAKASKASGDARAEYDKQAKALKAKQTEASKQLKAMGKATAASWDSAKQGFAEAYRDLQHAYERAAAPWKS